MRHITRPISNLLRGRPILAIFEACLRCNSACGYCDLPLNVGRYEMTREEIQRVFSHLYEQGLRFVFVQGGEPLLRKDLPELLEDFARIGFSTTLVTNGTRFTPDLVEKLSRLRINISVSLDTLDRERYRRIRGADQLRMVTTGIERLRNFPHPKYITCIVSAQNRSDILDVVRFALDRGFMPVLGAYHWDVGRYGKDDPVLKYSSEAIVPVFEEVLASGLVPRGYFRDYLRDNIRWLNGQPLQRCDAGRYSIAIDASGNVAPCLALKHGGNLRESPLEEILANIDREAIEDCSARSSCNMLCSRVVGSALRSPVSAAMTRPVRAQTG